jgi:signal transduction histidine kinase/CheY-like chemotaxis protein
VDDAIGERILVLAPTGRDNRAACLLLENAGLSCEPCSGAGELRTKLETGAGAAIVAEEAFFGTDPTPLFDWVRDQPPWSDFPFIVLTTRRDDPRRERHTLRLLEMLRNVTLLERPIQTVTLVSAVNSALRARRRQYEAAKYLIEREQDASRLEALVWERTRQLREANDQLVSARASLTVALDAAQMSTWDLHLGKYRNRRSRDLGGFAEDDALLEGWSRAIGKKHVLAEDRQLFHAAFRQALDTGEFRLECRIVWPDDRVRWVVAEGRLYRDEQGGPVRLAGTLRDVTEHRQVEETLRQTQKLEVIGQLTGGVAHDFNNLLTAVLGNIELAALRTQDEGLLRLLRSAAAAAERGAKVTGQLLAFARRQHLAPRVVILNELVSSMGDLLLQTIGASVRVETVLEKELWPVMIDATQLELAILNLAINGRDAMLHGGRLTIATRNIKASDRGRPAGLPAADYVAISVADTGTGMTQEVAAKAFEPFFSTKEIGKGTGLGLSQVLGFAQQSGGEVRIDTRLEKGTTVTLFLPKTQEALPRAIAEDSSAPHEGHASTILVVDDDTDVRDLTVRALSALNYRVLAADSGRGALDLLRARQAVDLVLIDLVMPGMSGRQLAARVRANDPHRPILFMTGYDDLPGTDDPFANEMVIKKPFKLVELAAAVENALGGRGRGQENWNVTPLRQPKAKR